MVKPSMDDFYASFITLNLHYTVFITNQTDFLLFLMFESPFHSRNYQKHVTLEEHANFVTSSFPSVRVYGVLDGLHLPWVTLTNWVWGRKR